MRRVLLIADLEGISGVDSIDQLVFGAPGYEAASRRMSEEVAVVARLLREHGVEHVRISDTHHSGADGNIDASLLPPKCELLVSDEMYGGALLDDVDAVACVGMHALGDTNGFGAHTVNANTDWSLGDERLSESRIVELLAAERGVPFWFTSGCDVLASQVSTPCVIPKRSLSRGEAASLPSDGAFRQLTTTTTPRLRAKPVAAPLRIRFQSRAEATHARGGTLVSPTTRELPVMTSFHAQFLAACALIESTTEATLARLEDTPMNPARLLLKKWE